MSTNLEYREKIKRATGQQSSRRKRATEKRVTRKFLEVSLCGRAKQWQRNEQKKCAALAKLFFAN